MTMYIRKNIIILPNKIAVIKLCSTGTVIFIKVIIQKWFLQVLQFNLQISALGWQRFVDTILFNLIQTDIKHQQTGNLRFRYFKEKNLFLSTSKLISGNSCFQRGQWNLYDTNDLPDSIQRINRLKLNPFYFFFYVQLTISYEIFHSFSTHPPLPSD